MKFENQGFLQLKAAEEARKDSSMPIRAAVLFEMFPFCMLYNVSIGLDLYLLKIQNDFQGKYGGDSSRNCFEADYSQNHWAVT